MPTFDHRQRLDHGSARKTVTAAVASGPATSGIGIEVELLPVVRGATTHRVLLHAAVPGRPSLRTVFGDALGRGGPVPLGTGAQLSVEPGGQLEVSTSCCRTVDETLAQAAASVDHLAGIASAHGLALVAAGLDVWHDVATVPQQLAGARYPAMASYFAARGSSGAVMMRHTCALQISLDLGPASDVRDERWLVANLLAPAATATFATSPATDGGVRSRRSLVWQRLDPTRTGFPRRFLDGTGTLEDQVLDAALDADVLLVRTHREVTTDPGVSAAPGRPGWRFRHWMEHGHHRWGWPTRADLQNHLTTLFPEVRARGPIELRSIDALPSPWRAAPVVLYAGALFDHTARSRIREVLERHRRRLPELLDRAAHAGVSEPELCALAVEVWSFALDGAARLAGVSAEHLATTERFLDRYTLRGRTLADELAQRLRRDPVAALDWMSEPTPTSVEGRR